MNILVVGNNPATHYTAQLLIGNKNVNKVYHCIANEYLKESDKYVPIVVHKMSQSQLLSAIDIPGIDLIIPTQLSLQLWPAYQEKLKQSGIPYLTPSAKLSNLEFSKIIGKKLLIDAGVPTADYRVYTKEELFKNFLTIPRPFVLKYDGDTRYGRQTIIVTDRNYQEEYEALLEFGGTRTLHLHGPFVDQKFIVEEFVEGLREYSYHALVNEVSWTYIGSARDYKKYLNGDAGNNTGGMGSYSTNNIDAIVHSYVDRIIKEIKKEGDCYIGFLYLGILVKKDGTPIVLEINTRPGDPEIQTIFPVIKDDVLNLLYNTATNQHLSTVEFTDKSAVSVKLVNKNFYDLPNIKHKFTDAIKVPRLSHCPDNITISYEAGEYLSCYATLTSVADSVESASDTIYNYLKSADIGEYTYRTDIGYLK
jgi:phosphoribosylamine--glycine ligase